MHGLENVKKGYLDLMWSEDISSSKYVSTVNFWQQSTYYYYLKKMNSCSVNNKQGGNEKSKEKGVPWPGQKEEY